MKSVRRNSREGGENYEIYDMDAADGSDVTRLTEDGTQMIKNLIGVTNTSTPGEDGDDHPKNKHDSKKKHHDDNAKKKH